MKKVLEMHLGKILNEGKPNETIDADVDIYIEASANESVLTFSNFIHQAAVAFNRVVLSSELKHTENIAELFSNYFESDSVNPYDDAESSHSNKPYIPPLYGKCVTNPWFDTKDTVDDKIEHMKLLTYSADGELTAMGENPNVLEMADHINGTIATLCKQAEKITGKDMSYYAYTAEIDPELYRDMHPLTAFHLMRDTYLKFAEILLAICKDCETEKETWLI